MIKNFKWLLLVSLTFVACNNDDETIVSNSSDGLPLTAGSANFSKFVALGNSLTAGFSDGALFIEGQKGSYANILAQQFALVGGGEFKIPFMNDNLGGLLFGGAPNPKFGTRLYFNGAGPVSVSGTPSTEVFAPHSGSYNNMGVPGAKSYHLLFDGYGNPSNLSLKLANPYFVRFATASNKSILQDAMAQSPTFFSLWIGNNDVLGYAIAGGVTTAQDPEFGGDITPPTGSPGVGFDGTYTAIINTLTAAGAKGVIANIPYVNTLPFFTTVPYNPLSASVLGGGIVAVGVGTIDALNTQLYGPLKAALNAVGGAGRIDLLSTTVANPLLIKDESLTNLSAQLTAAFTPSLGAPTAAFFGAVFGQARQAKATDLVLLTTQGAIAAAPNALDSGLGVAPPSPLNKFGVTFPLQDKHILIPTEINDLKTATDNYNVTIKAAADAKGLAFVDANAFMTTIANGGISANSYNVTNAFITGGGFSTDGVHPSPRGYALIANKFMEAINAKYGSNLKGVSLYDYRIMFPPSL